MIRFAGGELRALLLDLDDTILDNRTGLREAWDLVARMLAEQRSGLETVAVRAQIARSTKWFWSDPARRSSGRLDLPGSRRAILDHVLQDLGHPDPDLASRAAHLYSEHRDRAIRPVAGALRALERLRGLLPGLGLVTNGAAAAQRAKIERFGLAHYFDAIVIEGEFGAGKPEACVFEHATALLASPVQASLMVGDDYEADVLGALRAGLHAAWIDPDGAREPPSQPPRPHATVRSIVELPDRLRS